ncbi:MULTISPECIES: acyl carrier protein [Lactobacillaceae]|uniref:Acyl carrier protein n=1 Tax=Limosilactobacillus alvi TaxID=990412 RepID=A0ABS2EMP9_9LACO|nr:MULTISPECIES: acyl carrier protein [Lactobacillaceae]MBM6753695.1 acyl carrier protein [Limosilactobacillus alvi]QLL70521.1 acyl carrier protein [Lactobacillus sp. 3B(2020)]HJA72816.1 acyl carrier protein [Candidatus Limosilactobacillus faecipullorum]
MTKEEIFNTVQDIAAEELDVEKDKITLDAKIKDDLNADSLDVFEIMNELEDKFDIELDVDEGVTTIQDVVDFVEKQLAAK